ncbi:MAG: O-methyltransferase [bacterium]
MKLHFGMAMWLFGILGIGLADLAGAAETGSIQDLKSPEEILKFRETYIRDFKRIGLNTAPGDAMMLRILVQAARCRRGIEVGTATGYGAIVMGVAFERTGGELTSIDIDPRMVKIAQEHIRNMGLEKTVKVVEGDALKVLPALEGEYDFIFIDAQKQDYLKYFKAVETKLKTGAVIVADNVIQSKNAMKDFLDYFNNNPHYDALTVICSEEKSDGMMVIYKVK